MGNKKARVVRQEAGNKGSQAECRLRPGKDVVRCLRGQWNHKQSKGPEVGGSSRAQRVRASIPKSTARTWELGPRSKGLQEGSKSRDLQQHDSDPHY